MANCHDDECADMAGTSSNQLRQFVEEEHKDLHIEHHWMVLTFTNLNSKRFHFSVSIPDPHPGAIPTPPPNNLA